VRDFKPVHGVDYLVNLYSILGIPKEANQEQIKEAYRAQMKMYHPDVVSRAAPEIQKEAQRKSELIILAYKTLSNDKSKATYDALLKNFNPGLVSDTGSIKIDLMQKRVNIDNLVSGEGWGDKEKIIQTAKQLSGHDDEMFDIIANQYKEAENPPKKLKNAYRAALEKKNAYLDVLEGILWEDAGVSNQKGTSFMFNPEDHIDERKNQIKYTETEIAAGIEGIVLSLASGTTLKMLGQGGEIYDEKVAAENPIALKEKLTKIAVDRFKTHIPGLEKIAEERTEVMRELASLTEWEYYPTEQKPATSLTMVLEKGGNVSSVVAYLIKGDIVNMAQEQLGIKQGTSIDDLRSMKKDIDGFCAKGQSLVILHATSEPDITLQMGYVLNEHMNKLKGNADQ